MERRSDVIELAFAFALVVGVFGFVLFALSNPDGAERFMFGGEVKPRGAETRNKFEKIG